MFDKHFFFTPLFSTCFWIRDPGSGMGKNQDSGSGIRDKHPGSSTLLYSDFWFQVPSLMALGENQSVKATRTKFISFAG